MRRSICYTEPNFALAGQLSTWKFIYTSANSLPKGTKIKFDLMSKGRPADWELPQTNPKVKENLIWGRLPNGKDLPAKATDNPSQFEFTLPSEVNPGENFEIYLGSPDAQKGNAAQNITQRRKTFHLSIDPKGKGDYKDYEVFNMDIRGNMLKNLRIIAPSIVSRNKRFDVIVRFEDAFGNLTSNAPEGTLIDLSYEHLRENLSWKLFVPETGFITLPNLYFNEPGIYKIKLLNMENKETFFSPPIKCFSEGDLSLFWGLLHGESEKVDSAENIENCLRHFRDDRALQFYSTSSFDQEKETPSDIWKTVAQQITEFNEDDRFVAFLGFQWVGDPKTEGVRQILFTKDNKQIFRKKDTKTNSLKKIYKTYQAKEILSIPTFTMGKECPFDFDDFNPEFERVVEIYNAWGSSEMPAKEGNPRPIRIEGKKTPFEAPEGSIQKALNANCRFGFVAGGLDDRGIFSDFYEKNIVQYSPGLTGILAKDQNRSSLVDALQKRSCYATTGARMIVGLHVAGLPMGAELSTKNKPGLEFNRHLTGYIIGTEPLQEVVIIRNGKVIQTYHPEDYQFEFAYDDMEILADIAFKAKEEKPPFIYYYLRVTQKDQHIAWTSPIWVDRVPPEASVKKAKKKAV